MVQLQPLFTFPLSQHAIAANNWSLKYPVLTQGHLLTVPRQWTLQLNQSKQARRSEFQASEKYIVQTKMCNKDLFRKNLKRNWLLAF